MQDDKLQRLHDTLALLRPKGKTGGLGRGGGGTTKRKNDGLPDNPLYARFVRAGDGFSKVKKFKGSDDEDDGDDKGEDDSGDESGKKLKKKKAKKSKKKEEEPPKKAKKAKEAKAGKDAKAPTEPCEAAAAESKKGKKRRRAVEAVNPESNESSKNSKSASSSSSSSSSSNSSNGSSEKKAKKRAASKKGGEKAADDVPWTKAIKDALKEAPGKKLSVKALRKAVLKTLKGEIGDSLSKAKQKTAFEGALDATPKIQRFEEDGEPSVRYGKSKQ